MGFDRKSEGFPWVRGLIARLRKDLWHSREGGALGGQRGTRIGDELEDLLLGRCEVVDVKLRTPPPASGLGKALVGFSGVQ